MEHLPKHILTQTYGLQRALQFHLNNPTSVLFTLENTCGANKTIHVFIALLQYQRYMSHVNVQLQFVAPAI